MVIAVRTERGATGLEVVKVADDEASRARLAHEAEILQRAGHPGIVEVVGTTDSTLRLRHRGTSLGRLGAIAPDHAAAIVRAVADIVDSMHQQGLVHRRIDADHVVVNDRGRPHLCGFGEAGEGDETEQADDVAALGRLFDRLLDDSADALWSPAHRGVRAAPRRKRAMAAFRTAAAGAQRESAAQRLTARQLATAIGDALPGLSLPMAPGESATSTDGSGEPNGDLDPTADLGWSDLDLSMLAIDDEFGEEEPGDPSVRTDPYARLADLAGPDPEDDVAPPTAEAEDEAVDDDPDPSGAGDPDPIVAALRAAMDAEGAGRSPSTADDDAPPPPDREPETTGARSAPPRPADPLAIEIRPGHDDVTGDTDAPPRTSRRVLILVAVVLVVVGVVLGSIIARAVDPFGADSASASGGPDAATTPTAAETSQPSPPPLPEDCAGVPLPGPDVDDDGCPEEITLDGRVARVGDVEVELGQEGDLVSFADTDCDGIVTPVLLRPDTGEIFAFPEWSLREPLEVSALGVVDDAVDIGRGPEPCSPAVVTDGSGTDHEVPVR